MDLLFWPRGLCTNSALAANISFEIRVNLTPRREIIHYISGNVIHEYPYSVHPIPCSLYIWRGHLTLNKASPTKLVIFKDFSRDSVPNCSELCNIWDGPKLLPKRNRPPRLTALSGCRRFSFLANSPWKTIYIHKYEKRHITSYMQGFYIAWQSKPI